MHTPTRSLLPAALSFTAALLLSACGGGGGSDNDDVVAQPDPPKETGVCGASGSGINHDALMTTNCQYLSSYRLFQHAGDPTAAPAGNGIPYDLTTALFSDYTSKYRFVFVPEGTKTQYSEQETMEFPVGTVITKTFALPADTAHRGFGNETLLETRLLIHRENGWTALPYVWNAEGTEAEFKAAGAFVPSSLVHNGRQIDFTYEVPDTNMCKQCHQYSSDSVSAIIPIGPKARLLNRSFSYETGDENQLLHWQNAGILAGVPADLDAIATVPAYRDDDVALLDTRSEDALMHLAKGYLDVNCAHCHRPQGGASNTGLHLEYWRTYAGNEANHGLCKKPVAYRGAADLHYDLVPGEAEQSILHYRMNTSEPRHRMPEIGRHLVHEEGVALVAAWINRLSGACP